jgi:hypothetical protein
LSTILKALRRLEQDRAAEAEPSLEAAVLGRVASAETDRKTPRWLALALAAAALGAGAALLLERSGVMAPGTTGPVATTASPAPQAAAPVASPPPALLPDASPPAAPAPLALAPPAEPELPPAPAVAAPPPELADAIGLAGLPDEPFDLPGLPAPGVASDAPLPSPVPATTPSAPQTPEPVEQQTPSRVARLEPRVTLPKAALPGRAARGGDVGAVVAQPVTRGGLDAGEEEGVRSVEPPRKRTARVAPASTGISVLRTVWHPKPERRTAWLEAPGDASPRELREGDRVGSLTLLRIEPSAVIFDRDGVELRERIAERP